MRSVRHFGATLSAIPALLGLAVSWMLVNAILLLICPWSAAITRAVSFGDFGKTGRFILGGCFLVLVIIAYRWPVRGGAIAALFFAGLHIYDAWFHPPLSALSGSFWLLAVAWILVSESRALIATGRSHKGGAHVASTPTPSRLST